MIQLIGTSISNGATISLQQTLPIKKAITTLLALYSEENTDVIIS